MHMSSRRSVTVPRIWVAAPWSRRAGAQRKRSSPMFRRVIGFGLVLKRRTSREKWANRVRIEPTRRVGPPWIAFLTYEEFAVYAV